MPAREEEAEEEQVDTQVLLLASNAVLAGRREDVVQRHSAALWTG